jgi:hypothetical protein
MKLCVAGLALALSLVFAASASAGEYIVVLKDSVADPGAVATEHGQKYGAQRSQLSGVSGR